MRKADDLWILIHQLAVAWDDHGLIREERLDAAIRQFQRMPPTVRRELQCQLRTLALDLFDLVPLVSAAENATELDRQNVSRAG